MVHFLLLFPTVQDSKLRALLVKELRSEVAPLLTLLGFEPFRPKGDLAKGFHTKYCRISPEHADVITFVWMKRGEPAFVIDFDIIERSSSEAPTKSETERWFIAPRYRARANTSMIERWFHIGYLPRIISPEKAARKEVGKAKDRIIEIDRFARTGETSPYFRSNRDFDPVPSRSPISKEALGAP